MADEHGERFRSRSRSPHRMVDILLGNEGASSRRIPGLRGHLVYADDVGYTYVQNHQSTNKRQLRCSRYERGCTATASMSIFPENSPIVMYQPHNHHVGHDIEIGAFCDAMRQRGVTEGTPARTILEEEAKRFPNAAIEVSREQALRAIRYVRRSVKLTYTFYSKGDPVDRCFICLESWSQVNSANILVPCGHGWCCDECAIRLDKCGVCKVEFPTTQPIHIMHVNLGDGKWMQNTSLLDLTGSQCLGCMRHVQYVPDQAQYILLDCGHGWYCASCISTPPAVCDVCGDMVEDSEVLNSEKIYFTPWSVDYTYVL